MADVVMAFGFGAALSLDPPTLWLLHRTEPTSPAGTARLYRMPLVQGDAAPLVTTEDFGDSEVDEGSLAIAGSWLLLAMRQHSLPDVNYHVTTWARVVRRPLAGGQTVERRLESDLVAGPSVAVAGNCAIVVGMRGGARSFLARLAVDQDLAGSGVQLDHGSRNDSPHMDYNVSHAVPTTAFGGGEIGFGTAGPLPGLHVGVVRGLPEVFVSLATLDDHWAPGDAPSNDLAVSDADDGALAALALGRDVLLTRLAASSPTRTTHALGHTEPTQPIALSAVVDGEALAAWVDEHGAIRAARVADDGLASGPDFVVRPPMPPLVERTQTVAALAAGPHRVVVWTGTAEDGHTGDVLRAAILRCP